MFEEEWTSIEKNNNLESGLIYNLASLFPFDLTCAAVSHDQWDKHFKHLSRIDVVGAHTFRTLCSLNP